MELKIGSFITKLGNEIDYMECPKHGVVDVNGCDITSDYDEE